MSVRSNAAASQRPASGPHRWPRQGQWTYEDYARLPDTGVRYEVIEGALCMTPDPRPKHQEGVFAFASELRPIVLAGDLGKVYVAPIDVILPGLATPVQPDVLYLSRRKLHYIEETLIRGAPDLIAEVLSPTNVAQDRRVKFDLYARAGVAEYWIIDAENRLVEVHALRGQAYVPLGAFGPEDTTCSELLPTFAPTVSTICGDTIA